MLSLGVHTDENQKKAGTNYRLIGQELPNSVSRGWALYRQQYKGLHCHTTAVHLIPVFLSILCKWFITYGMEMNVKNTKVRRISR